MPIAVGRSECFVDKETVEQRDVMEEKEQAIETLERRELEAGSSAAQGLEMREYPFCLMSRVAGQCGWITVSKGER